MRVAGQLTKRPRMTTTNGSSPPSPGALTASHNGALNAAVARSAAERKKLERLGCYVPRGALTNERVSIDGYGLLVHELKRLF